MRPWSALLLFVSGLIGAGGVALAAWATHRSGGANLTTASTFMLIHAAAIAGLCVSGGARRGILIAATLLTVGVVLFAGDLSLRAVAGIAPWRMAAPTGGLVMIAGWLWLALAGLAALRR